MIRKTTVKESSDSTNRLKKVVDQSLALLCESKEKEEDATGRKVNPAPSRCRSLPLYLDSANLQKTAIVNAAKALTLLWKI